MDQAESNPRLNDRLLDAVLDRLGIGSRPKADLAGLNEVYGAWCRRVPFDNIRKMIALKDGSGEQLPGLDATEFFENWLATGSGGTCWPTSNALCFLLATLGFNCRRSAGAMFDLGILNHGTVKVALNGDDWLADTAILSNAPLPLKNETVLSSDPAVSVEIEPAGDSHMIWADYLVLPDHLPCRLLIDPAGLVLYCEQYEHSRSVSPFNDRLYVRVTGPGNSLVIFGNRTFRKNTRGFEVRECSRDEICGMLAGEIGISRGLIDKWIAAGGLDSTFAEFDDGPPPAINGVRPSLRCASPA